MKKSIIEQLQNVSPDKRVSIIQGMYKKNCRFFSKNYPGISDLLQEIQDNPYQINLTDSFLEIIDERDGELFPTGIALDVFAQQLGAWSHKAWIEFLEPRLQPFSNDTWHGRTVLSFNEMMLRAFPGFSQKVANGTVDLALSGKDRRFSNTVIFTGVFHGLHIDHFLSRTDITNVAFVEPDPYRFEVSLYFLDYSEIDKLTDGILLHVGDGLPNEFMDIVIRRSFVTSHVWLRVLPGYADDRIEPIVQKIRLKWLALSDTWIPGDRELRAMQNGLFNLVNDKKVLAKRPHLSANSRIAIIGAGPSLVNDIRWLKKNQNKLILFAAHSAVHLLQDNGISPDFQFALDIDWSDATAENLRLDTTIPLIVNYQTSPERISSFEHVFMVAGESICAPVHFHEIIPFMYPTTGNMPFAFAYYIQPEEIYLLGLDFAFRSTDRLHAKGSHYDAHSGASEKKVTEKIPVLANFKENKPVFTRGYYEQARSVIENAVLSGVAGSQVYNLSDGAFIQGSAPKHSYDVKLPPYPMKKTDIEEIRSVFEQSRRGVHWTPYEINGNMLLCEFKACLKNAISLEVVSPEDFAVMVDRCQFLVNETCKAHCVKDTRVTPYLRVVKDMLVTWYRFMTLAHSVEDIRLVYKVGSKALVDSVDKFEWRN